MQWTGSWIPEIKYTILTSIGSIVVFLKPKKNIQAHVGNGKGVVLLNGGVLGCSIRNQLNKC